MQTYFAVYLQCISHIFLTFCNNVILFCMGHSHIVFQTLLLEEAKNSALYHK